MQLSCCIINGVIGYLRSWTERPIICRVPAGIQMVPDLSLVQLEAELADLHCKKAALAFTSGWILNMAAIGAIGQLLPNCLILSDALNIIQ